MKNRVLGVAVATAALLALSTVPFGPASAAMISGELSLSGGNNLDLMARTITFNFGNPFNIATETGNFTTLGTGGSVTWRNQGTAISFDTLTAGSDLMCGTMAAVPGCMFQGSNGGISVNFNLTSEDPAQIIGGQLILTGTGIVQLTNFDPTPGTFSLTTQGGTGTNLTFSSTVTAVPGPIVGAGLPGLVAACGGLLGLARRRRNTKSH